MPVKSLVAAPNGRYFAFSEADGTIAVAYMPLWITESVRNGNHAIIRWQGGSGRFQVQQRVDLSSGDWQNVGDPTNENSATNSISGTAFFRVQSLR